MCALTGLWILAALLWWLDMKSRMVSMIEVDVGCSYVFVLSLDLLYLIIILIIKSQFKSCSVSDAVIMCVGGRSPVWPRWQPPAVVVEWRHHGVQRESWMYSGSVQQLRGGGNQHERKLATYTSYTSLTGCRSPYNIITVYHIVGCPIGQWTTNTRREYCRQWRIKAIILGTQNIIGHIFYILNPCFSSELSEI